MGENTVRKKQGFLQGAFILVIATGLVKILGAFFRIPLNNIIGELGMGYYSTAYDLYLPIYSLAMAGLPIAISRIVAECIASKRYNDARKTMKVARRAFLVTGFTGFVLLLAISYPFTLFIKNSGVLLSLWSIAPSLLFCCVMSSYRGYYEGIRNMYPTAVSSVIEALGKLILGISSAFLVIKLYGEVTAESASVASAAALMSISIGTGLGALYLVIKYKRQGDGITAEELASSPLAKSSKETLKGLVVIAIPIVLGSLATQISNIIDVTMVQLQISRIVENSPEVIKSMYSDLIASKEWADSDIANGLYGCYKGNAYSIYNLVPSLMSVLGVSALPVLATAWVEKNSKSVKQNMEIMIKTAALFAMPAGIGMAVLAEPIMLLLYPKSPEGVAVAAPMLTVLGIAAIFSGISAPLINMLQAIGKQNIPVRNIAVGAVLKVVINLILVGIPQINIHGAVIGTLVCYVYIATANFICLIKYSKVMPNMYKCLVKPLISAAVCGVSAYLAYSILEKIGIDLKLVTVISILIGVIFYAIVLILLRTIDTEDIKTLPKGEKIAKVLEKLKLI